MNDDRKMLHDLLRRPESGLVLKASDYFPESCPNRELAAFRLITNACQREFVTLWELFDHHAEFEACARELAREILNIRKQKRFAYAAAGSPAAKQLLDYVHAWIEAPQLVENPTYSFSNLHAAQGESMSDMGEELAKLYLGPQGPVLKGESVNQLDREHVLLVTDVIGRRGFIREMQRLVDRFGGQSVAIVAPVLISPDLILTELLSQKPPLLQVSSTENKSVRVHSMAHFPIRELVA